MKKDRRSAAFDFRVAAAEAARGREHPTHAANGDEQRYASACFPMSFTKGLEHDANTGLVADAAAFEALRSAIDNGFVEPFTTRVPVPTSCDLSRRQWEAPTAGVVFELEGPDPQAVTMAPAPALGDIELELEMGEVYELALLRDVHFAAFRNKEKPEGGKVEAAAGRLNDLAYSLLGFPNRPRATDENGQLDRQTVFRGASPGVEAGPYVSQFLLIGSSDQSGSNPENGQISYGGQTVDQRVLQAACGDDYMMRWADWLDVQNGFDTRNGGPGQDFNGDRRFITTPRDLATYVHFDALYQAYLNACLILLGNGTPFDPGFDLLSGSNGHELLVNAAANQRMPVNAGGFALWGGPHILSLVTEVATRGLKAVRFQKFNNHLRLRPETLAGRLHRANEIDEEFPITGGRFTALRDALSATVDEVLAHNAAHTNGGEKNALLPMAFAEGSPMHPTYGAGHATVAGACVTMLKAFFDTSAIFAKIDNVAGFYGKRQIEAAREREAAVVCGSYEASDDGKTLVFHPLGAGESPLTLEGELNKLAANISIGRNMAGVHYFSDYFDSVRMGEEIAIGVLEEQALGYQTDPFVLSVPTFDGETARIGAR